jgi:hypothetical protein
VQQQRTLHRASKQQSSSKHLDAARSYGRQRERRGRLHRAPCLMQPSRYDQGVEF